VQTIPLAQITGGMNHFAADAKRERFFFTGTSDKQLLVIDLKTGKLVKTISGFSPAAACFAPDLNVLCVSGAGAVRLYDGESYEPLAKLQLGSAMDELQYDPKTHRLYAGIMDAATPAIGVIDLSERRLVTKIKLPKPAQGFVLEQNGTRLFANTPDARQVTVIDRDKQAVVAEWKLEDAQWNYPAALDEEHHRLFVGCRKPARLLIVNTQSGKVVGSAETGHGADDMSFDPVTRRVYVACGGSGVITVVQQQDADHYEPIANVPTASGARNSLYVPELQRFYLGVPHEQDKPAELRAYEATR
jgi:DNA-binding beta-propeller fold protein YncE